MRDKSISTDFFPEKISNLRPKIEPILEEDQDSSKVKIMSKPEIQPRMRIPNSFL